MQPRILIVDDELSMREFLMILLEREGYAAEQVETADRALDKLQKEDFDLVISDICMPGLSGLSLLEKIKAQSPETAVLLITAFSTAEQAVEAMKLGAYDYIPKPFKVEEVKVLVKNALEKRNLQTENRRLREKIEGGGGFCGLIGKSKLMREVCSLIEKVAASTANVLILGESGTGKELAARAIHNKSQRKEKTFVAVNCGAIPDTLMESELFGHKKGAFTGAISERPGLFEQADSGTIFLDEIGEVPLQLQAKLLRVLQERELRRIGSNEDKKIDVRVIAASNKNLEEQVKEGSFREDLFYRLNVVEVRMPSLRERQEDIPLLVEHFYSRFTGKRYSKDSITAEALQLLMSYRYPGNVRELENIVERSLVIGGSVITKEGLPPLLINVHIPDGQHTLPENGISLEEYLDNIERLFLLQALERSGGVKKKAAEILGLTFRSFRYRLAKFGMDEDVDAGDKKCHNG